MNSSLSIQSRGKSTIVSWELEDQKYTFDAGFPFSDALIFPNTSQVVVLRTGNSKKEAFLGRVFDYKGKNIFDIPFPELHWKFSRCALDYMWCTRTDNGFKAIFGLDEVSSRDLWYDYDIEKRVYTSSGSAY